MSAAGWTVSDSATPPASGGWEVSDNPTPAAKGPSVAGLEGPLPGVPKPPIPAGLQGPPTPMNTPAKWSAPGGGFANTAVQAAENFGGHILNDLTAPVKAVAQPPQSPDESAVSGTMGGEAALAAYRMAGEPSLRALEEAVALRQQGGPQASIMHGSTYNEQGENVPTAGSKLVDAIPIYGPWARNVEDEAHQKGNIVAAAGLAGDVAAAAEVGKKGAAKVGDWASLNQTIPGENYTPIQHKALSGVLARGTGMGKDYFPKQVAQDIATPLRQAAADNPDIVKAIRSGAPEDALGAIQALLEKAKGVIDDQHQTALRPVADAPFDMRPVQNAVHFPKTLEGFSPEEATAVQDFKQRLASVDTLQGANDLRMYLNRELAPDFRKNAIAAGRSGALDSAMSDALSALRNAYYDQLEDATGHDFSGPKRTESSIMKAQEALGNAAPQLASRQALADEPRSLKATLGDALGGARTLRGGPVAGVANLVTEKLLGETPLGQIQEGLQRFLSKLPRPSPAQTVAPIPKGLPNPQLQLPANVPSNAEYLAGAGIPQAGAAAPPAQVSPGFNISPEGIARPGAPAPQGPAVVTPAPAPTPQLPAQTSPSGYGGWRTEQRSRAGGVEIPPRGVIPLPPRAGQQALPPPSGAPNFAAAPPSPPPPFNAARASERTNPPLPPNPQPAPATPAGFRVGPNGPERLPAGQLAAPKPAPSPATHEWSKSAWQAANPKRDLAKAATHARALGYKVVD